MASESERPSVEAYVPGAGDVGDVDDRASPLVADADVGLAVQPNPRLIARREQPTVRARADREHLVTVGGACGGQQFRQVLALGVDVIDQERQQRLTPASTISHPLAGATAALGPGSQLGAPDRAWRHPGGPALRLLGGPGLQVVVEGAHSHQHGVLVQPRLAVHAVVQRRPPPLVHLGRDPQIRLARTQLLDLPPEGEHENRRQRRQGPVVEVVATPFKVGDQKLADAYVPNPILINKFGRG
jgi:hypothetical protein